MYRLFGKSMAKSESLIASGNPPMNRVFDVAALLSSVKDESFWACVLWLGSTRGTPISPKNREPPLDDDSLIT